MFKSTFGLIKEYQRKSISDLRLVHKAVDFEKSVEIFKIGSISGEDVPFTGDIYVLKWSDKIIPFISKSQSVLSFSEINNFNKSIWRKSRTGKIPIVSTQISDIGTNLKDITHGPRGSVFYRDCFQSDFHGHHFSKGEYNAASAFIREAIPVLNFDNYGLPNPSPTICMEVTIEQDSLKTPSKSFLLDEIKSKVDYLTCETKEYVELDNYFRKHLNCAPLTLEIIFAQVLDMERIIFPRSEDAYPIAFWKNQELIEILRSSYLTYYSNDYPNFEIFLITMTDLIRNRYFARIIFERYS